MNRGADVDLIEEILRLVTVLFNSPSLPATLQVEPVAAVDVATETKSSVEEPPVESVPIAFVWLQRLSQLEKFSLTTKFADRQLIATIQNYLRTVDHPDVNFLLTQFGAV